MPLFLSSVDNDIATLALRIIRAEELAPNMNAASLLEFSKEIDAIWQDVSKAIDTTSGRDEADNKSKKRRLAAGNPGSPSTLGFLFPVFTVQISVPIVSCFGPGKAQCERFNNQRSDVSLSPLFFIYIYICIYGYIYFVSVIRIWYSWRTAEWF
jgi:hypothetical protein